jgi:hypothetical protein
MCSAKHYTCPQKAVQNYNYIFNQQRLSPLFLATIYTYKKIKTLETSSFITNVLCDTILHKNTTSENTDYSKGTLQGSI